jgi:hypothetical protein|tara:strand:+ start:348 stop:2939 length:2592 start_codon:yes stop_codon:yes gene_type:complete
MVNENPDDKFVDKSKLTQEVVDKYQTLLSQGASIKKIIIRLKLKNMVIVPENEKDDERNWKNKIAEHIATQILPEMGSVSEVSSARPQMQVNEPLTQILNALETPRIRGRTRLIDGSYLSAKTIQSGRKPEDIIDMEELSLYTKKKKSKAKDYDVTSAKKALAATKGFLTKPLIKNVNAFIDFFKEQYEKKRIQRKRTRFKFIDLPTEDIFSNKTLNDINQRKATYQYWKGIHNKFLKPTNAGQIERFTKRRGPRRQMKPPNPSELNQLLVDLKQTILGKNKTVAEFKEKIKKASEEKAVEMEDLLKFLETIEKIGSLNYIVKVERKNITLKNVKERAVLFIEKLLEHHGKLKSAFDVDDIEMVYEQITTEEGAKKDLSGIDVKDKETFEEYDDALKDDTSEVILDPLAIKYLKKDLDGLAEVYDDYKNNLLKEILEQFRDYDVVIADREDYEDFREKLEDALEAIDSVTDDEYYLPIFLFTEPTLKKYYKEEAAKAGKIQEDIFKFLVAYRDLIEDEKTLSMQNINLTLIAGSGSVQLTDLEQYKRITPSVRGTVKKFKKDMKTALDAMNDYIIELFVKPMHSIHRFGMRLPFDKNMQLRIIASASDDAGEGYLAYKEISKRMVESGSAFMGIDEAEDIVDFLELISSGQIYKEPEKTYLTAEQFIRSVKKIFNKNKKVIAQLKREVASIYGSLIYTSEKRKRLKDFMGIKVADAFAENRVDDPLEIQALQVLVDAIKQSREGLVEVTEDGQQSGGEIPQSLYERLVGEIDKVAKSEIYNKILEAHDSLRILKGKEIHYAKRNENNFEHVNDMLIKMQRDYNLDMSASELVNVVNEIDSFQNISKEYGIDTEHVYVIKANFR